MAETEQLTKQHVTISPNRVVEQSPDTTGKETPLCTPNRTSANEAQTDSAKGESLSSSTTANNNHNNNNITNANVNGNAVFEHLASEISKVAAALYLLKQLPNLDRAVPTEFLNYFQRKKETPSSRNLLNQSMSSGSPARKVPPNFPASVPLPASSSHGPFIRLVTRGHRTLVHLGQLVGILDDRSGFLLQRVVSYDPKRVQLQLLAELKPADILHLTESKLQQIAQNEKRAKTKSLLSSVVSTADTLEYERRVADVPSRCNDLTRSHGPVLTTPGLVLIRAEQVRELGIISDDPSEFESMPPSEWCKEIKEIQREQEMNHMSTKVTKEFLESTHAESSSQSANVILGNEQQTPINKTKTTGGQARVAVATGSNEASDDTKNDHAQQSDINKSKGSGRKRRIYRRRGGKKPETNASEQPKANAQNPTAQNQPAIAPANQHVATAPQTANTHQTCHDKAVVTCQQAEHAVCTCHQRRIPRGSNYEYRQSNMNRRPRNWSYCYGRHARCQHY